METIVVATTKIVNSTLSKLISKVSCEYYKRT